MQQLLESIASTIQDYRKSDGVKLDSQHVEKWINQFEGPVREPILEEIDYVLKRIYLSKATIKKALLNHIKNKQIVGNDPASFWKSCFFLSEETLLSRFGSEKPEGYPNIFRGNSQKDFLGMFDELLKTEFGYGIHDCGKETINQYIYLDDILFTGTHLKNDLEYWIKIHAPNQAKLYILLIGCHTYGQYYVNSFINQLKIEAGKSINQIWCRFLTIEDRIKFSDNSDVLRPLEIPPSAENYAESIKHPQYSLTPREKESVGDLKLFSNAEKRNLLEQEFLKEGVKILEKPNNFGKIAKPLGFTGFNSLGFGSLIVTFRNCPNNCPLVFWAEENWKPLFPRIGNKNVS